jgi:hypothetical protein
MIPLRKSTASQEVLLGPFLDDTDGKTAETALTINASDIKLWKRGGTTESSKNSGGATHIADGRYYAVLDATDTDTTGELIINVAVAGALPVRLVCCVFEAAVFDALFASGAAGYSTLTAQQVWEYSTRTLSAFSFTVSANVVQWNSGALPTIPTAGENADAVWDEAYAAHTAAGSFGKLMDTLRKSNYVTDGTVASGQTPTTTVFRSNLTAPSGTYDHQTMLFLTGVLAGESKPVDTYSATNGTFTLAEALTSAPTVGDEFVLLPEHVHPITAIAAGVRTELATELARIDVTNSSRLADADYTAPLDAAGTRSALGLASANLDTQLGDLPTAIENADALLGRSVANSQSTAAEWSLCTLVLAALESTIAGSTWTIYRTDGTTVHATKTVTTDASAEPITGVT